MPAERPSSPEAHTAKAAGLRYASDAQPGIRRKRLGRGFAYYLPGGRRVGNEEYARANGSFGITTLRNRHVRVIGSRARFRFLGKGGRLHEVDCDDRRIAAIVARCQELPGYELFAYLDDDGGAQSIG